MTYAGLHHYLNLCAHPILYNVYYRVCPFPNPPCLPTHPTHPIYLFLSKQIRNKSQKKIKKQKNPTKTNLKTNRQKPSNTKHAQTKQNKIRNPHKCLWVCFALDNGTCGPPWSVIARWHSTGENWYFSLQQVLAADNSLVRGGTCVHLAISVLSFKFIFPCPWKTRQQFWAIEISTLRGHHIVFCAQTSSQSYHHAYRLDRQTWWRNQGRMMENSPTQELWQI